MISGAFILFTTVCLSQCSQNYAMKMNMESMSNETELVYSWVTVDFDWSNETMKQEYIDSGRYLPFQNIPNGIDLYNGSVYITVSRFLNGVPSTLNKIVKSPRGFPIFQPFPSWDMQKVGDCNAFQNVPSVEIDPNNGWMWIIDAGRSSIFQDNGAGAKNACPAKLVIYDLNKMSEIRRYEFPPDVASNVSNFLNDLVIDYMNGQPAFAYITDSNNANPGLVVYDFKKNTSYRYEDSATMSNEPDAAIMVGTRSFNPRVPINGIAMSSNFRYVYFSAVNGYTLYQVPTRPLRTRANDISQVIRSVGQKESQSDGMIYARNNMYYGGLSNSSLYRWQVGKDIKDYEFETFVTLKTVSPIFKDEPGMAWIDSLAIDDDGYLWFTSSDNGRFFLGELNFTQTTEPNFRVWKTYIGEKSYLSLEKDGGKVDDAHASAHFHHVLGPILLIAMALFLV